MKQSIAMYLFIVLLTIQVSGSAVADDDFRTQQDQAVLLARSGNYDEALTKLDMLVKGGYQPALLDEIVILNWAKRYDQAISLFEKLSIKNIPEYVNLSAAGSYYQANKFGDAARIYHQSAQAGNRQAKRWEAECQMRLGNYDVANGIYDQLLKDNPNDVDTYFSRGNLRLMTESNTIGIEDLKKAFSLTTDKAKQFDLRAQIAAACIRASEFSTAVNFLKPTIDDLSATPNMQADYVFAMRLDQDWQGAIQAGTQLWPNPDKAPSYGVQALADAYLHNNQPKQAIVLYKGLLARSQEDIDTKYIMAGIAYAAIIDGQVAVSKTYYDKLLTSYPAMVSTVMDDTVHLMTLGRYWSANELYKLLVAKFPDNLQIRQQYAAQLARKELPQEKISREGQPREAAAVDESMAKLPGSQPTAGAGLVVNSLSVGDYQAARTGIDQLKGQSQKNPVVAQAQLLFANRQQGEVNVSASSLQDYQNNNINEVQITGAQRLGDGLSSTVIVGDKSIAQNGAIAHYQTYGTGLRYQDLGHEIDASVNFYRGDIHSSGYTFNYSLFMGDRASWVLSMDRAPVDEPLSVLSGIMASTQHLSYNHSLGNNDKYTLGASISQYNDSNHTIGDDGMWTHTYYDKNYILRQWFVYFNNNSWNRTIINGNPTTYDSSPLRSFYGGGFLSHWSFGKAYWENILFLEESRDVPETFSFSPHDRLEYGYHFSPNDQIILGVEYGMHTYNPGGGLMFDYRQYDIDYQHTW